MSGIDDCASQEIEASTSSNSTRNSKKYSFVQSILNIDDSQMLCSYGRRIILPGERVPRLPVLEKRDFIENWIIAHSDPALSPEKSCPASPILGISTAKRSPQSPILGYQWKRIKKEAKENCRVSLIKKLQDAGPNSPVSGRIRIRNENLRYLESGVLDCSDNDADKTLTSVNSPVLNEITNSPTLNASRVSCTPVWLEGTKSTATFDADSTLKWNNRQSLVRESLKVPETLSLSSPLGARSKRLKIEDATNDATRNIDAPNKQSRRFSELLVEESQFQLEVISSSSKISETLSLSMIVDDYEGMEVESKTRIDLKLERLHHRPSCFSPIKLEAETSFSHDRRSRVRESSNSSDRLSVPKNRPVQSEVAGTSDDRFSKIRESSKLPDTSVSTQLSGNLVPESLNLVKRLPLPLPLTKNASIGIKSINTSWIRSESSPVKFEAVASAQCIDRLSKIRESTKLPNTLSSERIDFESNTSNAPEDDIKIESDSDATISDFIENVDTQKFAAIAMRNSSRDAKSATIEGRPREFVDRNPEPRRDGTCDSDETYYSDGDSIPRLRTSDAHRHSQKISQSTSHSHEGRVSANRSEILISQAASFGNSNSEPPANVMSLITTKNNNKKKRKGKKGSLVAKLQTIVSSQVSNLRIWRYQMSQADFKNSRTQFVMVKVRERETRYGRHYLTASVIEDSHNLLKSLFKFQSNLPSKKSEFSSVINTITLMMVPEIMGVVKIRADSSLKIYPPWEIMDQGRKILNVMFFNVIAAEEVNVVNKTVTILENERVIEEFDCPCIEAQALVDSCRVQFTNTKPSVMQAVFGS